MCRKFRIRKVIALLCAFIILTSGFGSPQMVSAAGAGDADPQIMVSLGDSYSSGEGIEEFYGQNESIERKVANDDWLAHRSTNSWPGMLTLPSVTGPMKMNRDTRWFFTAVSGAVTADLSNIRTKKYKKGKYSGSPDMPPQLEIFDRVGKNETDYVTLTLGGNDADFTGIITEVVLGSTYLNKSSLSDKINDTWVKFYKHGGIGDCLRDSYEKISQKAGPQAHIIVAGYPKLLDASGKGFFQSEQEASTVNIAVSNFNNAIEHIVNSCSDDGMNISFVSVESEFDGHEAYSDDPYISEIIFGPELMPQDLTDYGIQSSYSLHPNYKGAEAYARCVQAEIDKLEGNTDIAPEFTISTLDYYGQLHDDYTIDIKGVENVALWGLITKDYNQEITVRKAEPVLVSLPEGRYKITVSDEGMSYYKKVIVHDAYENDSLTFNTKFGYAAPDENTWFGGFTQSDLPPDAVEFNGHWYKVMQDSSISGWKAAQQYCNDQNGYLATITSAAENDFLYDYITQAGYSSAYIGLSDAVSEGNWTWGNGEKVSYTNWHRNEPNAENSNEDYAMFYYKYSDGTWNDGDFGSRTANGGYAFICEWGEYTRAPEKTPVDKPVRTTSDERDIVLVLDVSGSMSGTPIAETQNASVSFIDTILDEDASIGIVTYDNSASILSDFSVDQTALTKAVSGIWSGGGTNIEAGLAEARTMLNASGAKKKIIVLMSDGEPNDGKEGDALISYADKIKNDGIIIYTLGFFESLGGSRASAQILMEGIASDGCHYEVSSADDLIFFFEDMADQINGQKYIYIRIACPVDVSVTHNGETLCSSSDNLNMRTGFGTLTFEDNDDSSVQGNSDDKIKVLRLKEGMDYHVKISGTGHGLMDYTIGFMDENGDYSDFRRFENIKITRRTEISTIAAAANESVLNIDEDGDGKYDLKLRAEENGYGEEVKPNYILYIVIASTVLLMCVFVGVIIHKRKKRKDTVN